MTDYRSRSRAPENDIVSRVLGLERQVRDLLTRSSRTSARQTVDGTAAPVTGTWTQGDQVRNIGPTAIGQPIGWVCIADGTPGTWRPFGVIA